MFSLAAVSISGVQCDRCMCLPLQLFATMDSLCRTKLHRKRQKGILSTETRLHSAKTAKSSRPAQEELDSSFMRQVAA